MKRTIGIILAAALFFSLSIPSLAADYGRITVSGENNVYEKSQVTVVFEEARMETRTLSILEYGELDEEIHDYENQKVILVKPNSTITITDSVKGNETDFWPYSKEDGNVLGGDYPRGWTGSSGNVSDWILGKSLMGGGDIVAALSLSLKNEAGQEETYTIMLDTDSATEPDPEPSNSETSVENPFTDVTKSDPYYDAVLWAYYADPQITNGMTDTTFGPELTVTRGQCVTFLWRAMGEPEPSGGTNPFTDVPASQYYYKAVLWAVEKGITDGVTDTTFEPNATLSTQHIITFLYRTLNPGEDGWSGEAAAWAGKNYGGKPFGIDTAVNNKTDCPRANVVQFLYEAVK